MLATVKAMPLWLVLWLIATIIMLMTRPVLPVDETRYLSVAWEMWHSHQYLVPAINGQPYSHKPPLLFWLINGSWRLFGVSELAARIVAPLFGLGSLLLTAQMAAVLWPDKPAIRKLAPYLLLGMPVWLLYASLTMFDTLVCFFSLAAWLTILTWERRSPLRTWGILGLIIGLGLLAKGPVLLLFVVGPLVLAPWWMPNKPYQWRHWYGGSLLAIVFGTLMAALWALPAAISGGQTYGAAILYGQTAGRLIQSFAHHRPVYWYALLIPLLLFPWSCWPPVWRRYNQLGMLDYPGRFCLSILVPSLVSLSLVSGKQIHYLMPLLPVFALLFATAATATLKDWSKNTALPLAGFLLLSLLLAVAPLLPSLSNDATILQELSGWSGAIPLGLAAAVLYLLRKQAAPAALLLATACLVLVASLHLALSSPAKRLFHPGTITAALSAIEQQGLQIAVFPKRFTDQFHFAAALKAPVVPLNNQAELARWLEANPQHYSLLFVQALPGTFLLRQIKWQRYHSGWLLLAKNEQLSLVYGQDGQSLPPPVP